MTKQGTIKRCEFDKNGVCYALACYTRQECGARDGKGNPKYASPRARGVNNAS